MYQFPPENISDLVCVLTHIQKSAYFRKRENIWKIPNGEGHVTA